jgi:hypothetical protein
MSPSRAGADVGTGLGGVTGWHICDGSRQQADVLGQALLDVTKSPVTRWAFGVGAVAMVVSACLFASIWFFNRPRFLVPPALRDLPGTLRAPGRTRSGHHTRK